MIGITFSELQCQEYVCEIRGGSIKNEFLNHYSRRLILGNSFCVHKTTKIMLEAILYGENDFGKFQKYFWWVFCDAIVIET